jgi:hypothetical protein
MTQGARKGKLYQLQYQIDLSCFIVARLPRIWLLQRSGSTKLLYFVNTPHKADCPAALTTAGSVVASKPSPPSPPWRDDPYSRFGEF